MEDEWVKVGLMETVQGMIEYLFSGRWVTGSIYLTLPLLHPWCALEIPLLEGQCTFPNSFDMWSATWLALLTWKRQMSKATSYEPRWYESSCVSLCVCSVTQSYPTFWDLMGCRLLCPWDFPGKNTGVGCHFLLQVIFPTQGSNPCLLHWQADSLPLSQLRSLCFPWPFPFLSLPWVEVASLVCCCQGENEWQVEKSQTTPDQPSLD